ncbi:MAG TPA: hypothetical protein VIJ77_10600 [Candidatus Tumulicola sp.]|jgi:hypothetical protein
MKILNVFLCTSVLGLGLATAAYAQPAPSSPYNDTSCGSWQGDTWTPNGTCTGDVKRHAKVEGTITIVKGHLVTVQQSTGTVIVDDTPALNNQFTGKVAVGRRIVAHGYWNGNNFYATMITTSDSTAP